MTAFRQRGQHLGSETHCIAADLVTCRYLERNLRP